MKYLFSILKKILELLVKQVVIQLLMAGLATFNIAYGQGKPATKEIKGVVIDAKGALESATIKIKGLTTSTFTDKSGTFTIKAPVGQKLVTLIVTSVGYSTKEILVTDNNPLKIILQESISNLNDVVVIGYGSVKRKDLTGSVGRVNTGDLQKAPVKSFDDALAGRVAGVLVASNDGQPGSNSEITIRGVGSVTQSSSPLYVIDGFPQEDANANSINPLDIESIEVLKDASSTAIYGARGANGVIIITTKKGKSAVPIISYAGTYGYQNPLKKMELMKPYEFVRLQNDINPFYANFAYFSNGKTLDSYKGMKGIDWQDLVFKKNPGFQNQAISLSARTQKTAYVLSGSYTSQEGLIINSGFGRYQARFNIDQEVSDKLRIGLNTNFSHTKSYGVTPTVQNQPLGSSVNSSQFNYLASLWSYRPLLYANATNDDFILNDLVDQDAIDGGISDNRVNPYISTINTNNNNFNNTVTSNGYIEYKFSSKIKLRVAGGVNYLAASNETFNNSNTLSGTTLFGSKIGVNGTVSNNDKFSYLNENTLTYVDRLKSGDQINAVVGFTSQEITTNTTSFTATNLPNEVLGIKGIGQGVPYAVTSSASINRTQSYLGRVNYV